MERKAKFEKLEHRMPNGITGIVPLYLEAERLTPESETLLMAAGLVGANLKAFEGGLDELVNRVGEMLTKPESKGLLIEDEDSGGSLRIDRETTRVSIRNQGQHDVPTPLFFDMLYSWVSYRTPS